MNRNLIMGASVLAAGMLLVATPALADTSHSGSSAGRSNAGAFFDLPLMHVGVTLGQYKNNHKMSTTTWNWGTTTPAATSSFVQPYGNTIEIGVVGSTNVSGITLDPAINLNGTSTAATTVVTNASTTFKGGATSTASLTSGEKVLVVGTTSTSTAGTITASIVIALQNAWHFCTHLFSR